MHDTLYSIRQLRLSLLSQLHNISNTQLNHVPPGGTNNIIWNLGHMNAALYLLCYRRSGLDIHADKALVDPFITGTKPVAEVSETTIASIKKLFIQTIDRVQSDYTDGIFQLYTPSENIQQVYGISLNNIEDAFRFLLYHDGWHGNCIASLMRQIRGGQVN